MLFAVGSMCFVVGPFPDFVHVVGAEAGAAVFFAGSRCFTTAAALQCRQAVTRTDRWAEAIQLAGAVFFDLSTLHGLQTGLSTSTCHGHRETRSPPSWC